MNRGASSDKRLASSRPLRLREILRAGRPSDADLFPDLYGDYEEYHAHVDTGQPARATLISPWIEPGSRVLDAGCGDGTMAEFLRTRLGATVEGVDISEAAVEKTRARGIAARVQDLDANPTFMEGFDYILFIEVLEHLRVPHRVLTAAARRAGRAVILTLPNSGWIGYRLQALLGHAPVQSYTHLHFWTHRDFLAFARRLNLPRPEMRCLVSEGLWRRSLVSRWPNLLAHQLAYRIPTLGATSTNRHERETRSNNRE